MSQESLGSKEVKQTNNATTANKTKETQLPKSQNSDCCNSSCEVHWKPARVNRN